MNKYLSILQLNIRRNLWKVLVLLVVFAAAELAWFAWRLSADAYMTLYKAGKVFGTCFVICLAAAAFVLGFRRAKGSRPSYSLGMLGVDIKAAYIISLIFDMAAMLLVWAGHMVILLAASRIYMAGAGYTGGPQGALVEIYSSPALVSILPLEIYKYRFFDVQCILAFSFAAASMESARLRGGFPIAALLTILAAGASMYSRVKTDFFSYEAGLTAIAVICAVFALLLGLAGSRGGRKEDDDGE